MSSTSHDISPPAAQTTFGALAAVSEEYDKSVTVFGTAGTETVQISASADGTNFVLLTGTGQGGQLPTNGSIAADGEYAIPQNMRLLKAQKTAGGGVVVVSVIVRGRKS